MKMKFLLMTANLFMWFIALSQDSIQKPLMVQTIGKLPYLEYGLGDDRLGGAKMTYLDSGVVLKVVDSMGFDYKVQLSKNHSAYIAKESVQQIAKVSLPYYLTSSWRVYGNDTTASDYVTINLDERLPYRSVQQINPSRIAIDIFGATSNTNWISQFNSVKEIKNAWYEQTEDDVMRVFIELKHAQHWGYHIAYDSSFGAKLIIRVKRQPAVLALNKLRVAIDAGHGGENVGASGITSGIKEKDYTLKIATQLEALLKKAKVKTFMTRTTDTTLDMPSRIEMLRNWDPDILISIHLNSSNNVYIKGVSTYYRYIGFRSLSQAVMKRMLELKLIEIGNVGSFNFALSGPTDYPNCLVEVAFLSNMDDEKKILDPKFRAAVAKKIFDGITDWVKKLQ